MKALRITQSGMTGYTGVYCGVQFVDGVSSEEITARQAAQIANIIQAEWADDGVNPSDTQSLIDIKATEMTGSLETGERYAMPDPNQKEAAIRYTREELLKVADEKGIEGLREIATPMNIKGVSIAKLIEGILGSQDPMPAEAAASQPAEVSAEAPAALFESQPGE